MMASAPIEAAPRGRIEGNRVVTDYVPASCPVPLRMLGVGDFTVGTAASGLPQLLDPQGRPCGIFANPELARQTAARLSQ